MAKTKRKRIVKPDTTKTKTIKEEHVMDGLNVPFEEVMQFLSTPLNKKPNSDK
jgi:hypothetical protein